MPGFDSHYVFGQESLKRLDRSYVLICCKKYPRAYALGNQGPDSAFFFYESIRNKKPLGFLLHTGNTKSFFLLMYQRLRKIKDKRAHAIATAYMAGYLGHYAFDSVCHPFVYARTDFDKEDPYYGERHAILETDIDHVLVKEKLLITPSQLKRHKFHWLSREENKVIRKFLMETTYDVFPTEPAFQKMKSFDLYTMPLTWAPMKNKSGAQKKFFKGIEKLFHIKGTISSQIYEETAPITKDPMNIAKEEWKNPWDSSIVSTESVYDLFEKGLIKHHAFLVAFNDSLMKKEKIFLLPENLSFLSGLDYFIPY